MSGRTPVPLSAQHRHQHCAISAHAQLQSCSTNLHLFVQHLVGSPHHQRILMDGEIRTNCPTSSVWLELVEMWNNAVQSSVADRTPRQHKLDAAPGCPLAMRRCDSQSAQAHHPAQFPPAQNQPAALPQGAATLTNHVVKLPFFFTPVPEIRIPKDGTGYIIFYLEYRQCMMIVKRSRA